MDEREKEILLAFAKCNMNLSETARKTYMHRNTVEYNLELVKGKTGLNPKKFFDLIKLVKMCGGVAV